MSRPIFPPTQVPWVHGFPQTLSLCHTQMADQQSSTLGACHFEHEAHMANAVLVSALPLAAAGGEGSFERLGENRRPGQVMVGLCRCCCE